MNSILLRHLLMLILLWSVSGVATAQTVVRFQTDFGDIDVELEDVQVPGTVTNFLSYVDDGDYRQSFIHRNFLNPHIIQGGGFTWDGFWADVPVDAQIDDEVLLPNDRGTIAMAKTALPNTATSQWYINVQGNPGLDPDFTVFGHVIAGMDAVDTIHALQVFNGTAIHPAFTTLPLHDFVSNPMIPDDNLVFTYRVLRVAEDQCGDANDDLVVDDLDPELLRVHLADPLGTPLTPAGIAKCDTIGTPGSCDSQDVVVMLRWLGGLQPPIAPVCTAAGP